MKTPTTKLAAMEVAYGKLKSLLLPSGRSVIIREQNGNDDEILSNPLLQKEGTALNHFISAIIIEADWKKGKLKRITAEEAGELLTRDRSFIVISSRIHSIGDILQFEYDWGTENKRKGPQVYSEDLKTYLWDYTKPFPEKYILDENGETTLNPIWNDKMIPPYVEGINYGYHELVLQSGKKVRFNLLDGKSEIFYATVEIALLGKTSEFRARRLEQYNEGKWIEVKNFGFFTSREMAEMRKYISEIDAPYMAYTDITEPNTKEVVNYPILSGNDFFYPEGI